MRPTEFIRAAKQAKLGTAYFLRGPDPFLQEECRRAVVNAIPEEARAWCLTEIEFQPGKLARALEGARQMPMLGGRTVLIFFDPEDFRHAADADHEALAAYLGAPSPFSTIIFTAAEPDRRRRLIQLLEKKAEVVEIAPLERREAAEWLAGHLRAAGVEITPELAEEIVAKFETTADPRGDAGAAGVNLLWVRTEVEKLLISVSRRSGAIRLERGDLELLAGFREEHVIARLLQAVAERNFAKALEQLRVLLASKESEMLLLWSIGDLFRQALKAASAAPRQGATAYGAGRQAWTRWSNPFSNQEIALTALKNYSQLELLRAIRQARRTDLGIKSSWKDSKLLLEYLLWQIVVGKTAESAPAFELPAPAVEA